MTQSLEPMMPADVQSRAFYRTKRFWISAVLMGLVCLPVAYFLFANWALKSDLAKIRAAGLPTNGAELNDFYFVPEGEADSTELWLTAIQNLDDSEFQTQAEHLPFVGNGTVPNPGEEWEQLDDARQFLSDSKELLKSIHAAAEVGGMVRFPVDFSQGIYTLLPDTQNSRTVARLLSLDAHVAVYDGDNIRVLHDILAMFALSDALQTEPCMISQLMRMALHAIGCDAIRTLLPACKWDDEQLATLQRSVVNARFRDSIRTGLLGERAMTLTEISKFPYPLATSSKRAALPLFQMAVDALDHPWPEAIKQQHAILQRLETYKQGHLARIMTMPLLLLFGGTEHYVLAGARNEARQRCTIAAIAAERHRLQHGQYPDSLSDIAEHLFPEGVQTPTDLITDPFTAQHLLYLMTDTHATIYSVGENGTDDGGQVDSDRGQPLDVGFSVLR